MVLILYRPFPRDSTDIVAFTRTNVDEEATKGEHTLNQLRLLDSIIESRIRLQQSLNLCNRLPQVRLCIFILTKSLECLSCLDEHV